MHQENELFGRVHVFSNGGFIRMFVGSDSSEVEQIFCLVKQWHRSRKNIECEHVAHNQ